MHFKKIIFSISLIFITNTMYANGVSVANVFLSGQNTTSHYSLINFAVSWNNSWRVSSGPSNWDAVWVFAKFRKTTSTVWNHATLNWVNGTGVADGHTVPAGASMSSSNDNGAGGAYGVFIYSSSNMIQGTVNYTGSQLRWNYGVDALTDADSVELCVFAIEMIYVPSGSFYVGDGNLTIIGQFRNQASNTSFQITSEASLTLGGSGPTNLNNNNTTGQNTPDDFNNLTVQTLPAAFPKGFASYYCMKYEITQDQYVEFLNKLTRVQQATRCAATTVGNYMSSTAGGSAAPQNRNGIKLISDPGGISSRVFGCDLNNNGVPNEAADGQNIACNWINFPDLSAYLDWSGLRPMTELEYEKTCRGPNNPVAGEYAWESIAILGATTISAGTSGASNETSSTVGANCVYNNAALIQGPMRVGNFAQAGTNQVQAGAGYFGAMDLTGNLFEIMVSVGSAAGRSFSGLQGNGALNNTGDADVNYWPGINGNATITNPNGVYGGVTGCTQFAGYGFNGSSWNDNTWLTVSGRAYRATWSTTGRDNRSGGRGVRTAP
ncbi:MAG TPA: hypothetical protein VK766_10445 [Cytophagaceae bacterium]|jgi:formylglycine-generating enzyme required for sulfatase activity|nr:hypothetical protein [Cytophagaceae bacterium]